MFRGFSIAAVLATLSLTTAAGAAELRVLDTHPEGCNALLTGQIAAGDTDRLRALFPGSQEIDRYISEGIMLCLDSPGGSFLEGLELARHLRHAGIASHVPSGAACLSACALAFLGGSRLNFEDAIVHRFQRSIHATARLGFHAPELDIPSGNFSEAEVKRAFALALKASAMIFTRLDDLGISRDFALAFFDVPEGRFYEIDTGERADEAGITVTGTGPLPSEIGETRVAALCARTFDRFDPQTYENPDQYTRILRTDFMPLPPVWPGTQRAALLLATTGEGMLMWDACEVVWVPGEADNQTASLRLTHHEFSDFDVYDFENPQPLTRDKVLAQLDQNVRGRASLSPLLALPAGTLLRTLADGSGPRDGVTGEALCTPIHDSYEVYNVQSFSNLRRAPGFDAEVVAEVGLGTRVTPVSPDFDSTRLISEPCLGACRPASRGRVTSQDIWAIRECRRSDQVWWQVRTPEGTTGWLGAKFLTP